MLLRVSLGIRPLMNLSASDFFLLLFPPLAASHGDRIMRTENWYGAERAENIAESLIAINAKTQRAACR